MRWIKWIWSGIFVVIGLFLIALFLPFSSSSGHPPGARDLNTAYNLKNAISAYFTEYREYPILSPDNEPTLETSHRLMDIVLGSDEEKKPGQRNPRGIAFYSDKAAKLMEDGRFRRGVTLDPSGGGELWDSWGNHYRVRFDSNFDNQVENPESPGIFIPESILVWSAGKDGDFDTWEDNVKTW